MTNSIKKAGRRAPAQQACPILVYANWFQFRAGERLARSRVESRMLLSVHRGSGVLRVNGQDHIARTGSWFFLPWAHAVEYHADPVDPFFVGGIHLIPDHDHGHPVRNQVAHESEDPLAGASHRRSADWHGGNGLLKGFFSPKRQRFGALIEYLIESFDPLQPDESKQRQAAEWLLGEISLALKDTPPSGSKPLPEVLPRLESFVRKNLKNSLGIPDLARAGNCSIAGIHRLFRLWLNETPAKWVAGQRAEHAALLLRTTRMPIKQIAEEVGISDPFQFSRFFKRHTGCSPRIYRHRQGIL